MRTLRSISILALLVMTAHSAQPQWHSSDPAQLFDRFQFDKDLTPSDSVAFARYRTAFEKSTPDIGPLPDPREYSVVWAVQCEGMTRLVRGNGTDLKTFLQDPPEKRFGEIVCCPRFYGGRYAVVHWEPPTGLVRYRYWFFERRSMINEKHGQSCASHASTTSSSCSHLRSAPRHKTGRPPFRTTTTSAE
jgi:hypothetical protein